MTVITHMATHGRRHRSVGRWARTRREPVAQPESTSPDCPDPAQEQIETANADEILDAWS